MVRFKIKEKKDEWVTVELLSDYGSIEIELYAPNDASEALESFIEDIKKYKLIPAKIVKFEDGLALGDVYRDDKIYVSYYNDYYWGERIALINAKISEEELLKLWITTVKKMVVVERDYTILEWKVPDDELEEIVIANGKVRIIAPRQVARIIKTHLSS